MGRYHLFELEYGIELFLQLNNQAEPKLRCKINYSRSRCGVVSGDGCGRSNKDGVSSSST